MLIDSDLIDGEILTNGGVGVMHRRAEGLAHRVPGTMWGPWERALIKGEEIEVDGE